MKRCYYRLTEINGDEPDGLVLNEKCLADYLESVRDEYKEEDDDRKYEIEIVYMTEDEFENLPEYQF